MAKFSRLTVANHIMDSGLMPLFYDEDLDTCKKIVQAIYDGGGRIIEFTNRGDFAHEVFKELNKWCIANLKDLILGVGTVIDAPTAAMYIQLGANFIISPLFNPDLAKICNRRKVLWIPGCATLSEISAAEELGVEFVKLFPANTIGGKDFIKAIKGPCPWTNILATGGVDLNPESIKEWFSAGVAGIGLGSQLINAKTVKENKFDEITQNVNLALFIIASLKSDNK